MALRAVFLDLGGTLMDPESDRMAHLAIMRTIRRVAGLSRDAADLLARFQEIFRRRTEDLGTRWIPGTDLNREILAAILQEDGITLEEEHWQAYLEAHWREHLRWLRPFPEVKTLLGELRQTGLHIGLLSDIDEDFLQLCLYALPLEGYLDSVTTSQEVGVAKPHRAIFLRALSKASCRPAEALHVGDSPERDAMGARRVGMYSILISPLDNHGRADYVVGSLREAHHVLRKLLRGGRP